ncbi:GNAT family N-acetyltransferase [Collinsella sp. An2]|uniref:GNAT family N-acetyltransferase n=1 Tax=Collinsella sp. An2 TaxID=1965585 RepID=UPI000B3ADDDA|nr:GNAT family N-acetyltransferase [Collinsella sp. An2]OUP09171.1 hypothetical protein B5F33_05410 [Collinsella sp. An2]
MTAQDWPHVVLATERLVLRPWRDEDAEALYELARDPRVGSAAGWPPHASVAESRQTIRDVLSTPYTFAMFERVADEDAAAINASAARACDVPVSNVREEAAPASDVSSAVQEAASQVSATAGRLVGCIGLTAVRHVDADDVLEMELGYWLGVPFWGKGYMTEAARELVRFGFDDLGLSTIWACYFDGNERSKHVMERLGMTYHHVQDCKERTGGAHDLEHVMVLRRP